MPPTQDTLPSPKGGAILVDPSDPYLALAQEMARREGLPIVPSFEELLKQDPAFALWVVSPSRLSDQVLIDVGLAMRQRPSALSLGIISGQTLEDARDLWLRAPEVKGERVFAANAANPSGHIAAGIRSFAEGSVSKQPLTKANLIRTLQAADYLTFTGHGGRSFLGIEEGITLRPADIPSISPAVIATGSCNTFRPWEENSIALAFARQGAAAYAGFAYSPNEGYLIGEFDGLAFRYTWPDFPVGYAIQVQNHGTLQGFAQIPYYYLLGDPRIALQSEAPYRLQSDRSSGDTRDLTYSGAPPGILAVHIPGGARYSFVQIPGVSAAWERDPFYNARLQMVNIGEDKYLLFAHQGGDFALQLHSQPPPLWLVGDVLADALDNTLLYLPQTGGDILSLIMAGFALVPVVWLLIRKRASARMLIPAALIGLSFALLHGLYAWARLEKLTITSKIVEFSPLALLGTFLLVSCGAFLFLNARSWLGKAVALLVACLAALAPALFILGMLFVMNHAFFRPRVGTGLYNYVLGLQLLLALAVEVALLGLAFWGMSRLTGKDRPAEPAQEPTGRQFRAKEIRREEDLRA
jgi:hypothetical protein